MSCDWPLFFVVAVAPSPHLESGTWESQMGKIDRTSLHTRLERWWRPLWLSLFVLSYKDNTSSNAIKLPCFPCHRGVSSLFFSGRHRFRKFVLNGRFVSRQSRIYLQCDCIERAGRKWARVGRAMKGTSRLAKIFG